MTLYAVTEGYDPNHHRDELVSDEIGPLENGWSTLQQAAALWRLVEPTRAEAVQALIDQARAEGWELHPLFDQAALISLVGALTGLDRALIDAGIMDEHWLVPADSAAKLAAQVPGLDARETRTAYELQNALAEVLILVDSARSFLQEALADGRVVIFG